jgi:hypothetical protein
MTVNAAPLGDLHKVATQFCGGDAVPGCPIVGIICGWGSATAVCHLIAVDTGLTEVLVGVPRIHCRLAENKHAIRLARPMIG